MKDDNFAQMEKFCPGITPILEETDTAFWKWTKTKKGELNLETVEGIPLHDPEGALEEARKWFEELAPFDKQILFIHGIGLGYFYEVLQEWLHLNPRRYLIFYEDDPVLLKLFLETEAATKILADPQVILRFLPNPEKIGWGRFREYFTWLTEAFCSLNTEASSSPYYIKHRTYETNRVRYQWIMNLRFYNYFYEERVFFYNLVHRNFFRNLPLLNGSCMATHLYEKFQGIPFILCGAGPSLTQDIPLLKSLENRAIILGSATGFNILNRAGVFPHFGLCIDPYEIQESRQLTHFGYETPFFYQLRFYHKATPLIHGPRIYIGNYNYEKFGVWFNRELKLPRFENVELGVSTSNVFAYLAIELGCEPLIYLGMDLSFKNKTRYAEGITRHGTDQVRHAEHDALDTSSGMIVYAKNNKGEQVETKWNWLEEATQFTELAKSNSKRTFINATVEGLEIFEVPAKSLEEVAQEKLTRSYDILNWIHTELVQSQDPKVSLDQIEEAINKWQKLVKGALQELRDLEKTPLDQQNDALEKFSKTEIYIYFLRQYDQLQIGLNLPDLEKLRLYADKFTQEVRDKAAQSAFNSRLNTMSVYLRQSLIFIEEGKGVLKKMKQAPPNKKEKVEVKIEPLREDLPHDNQLILKYPDGSVKGEMRYYQGKLHGISTFYSPTGIVLGRSLFVEDKRVGQTLQYDLEGNLVGLLHFDDAGLRDQTHLFFYPHGTLKSKIPYKKGVLDGTVELYFPSGQIKRKQHFVDGKLEGLEQLWNAQGLLITEAQYKNSLPFGTTRTWYDNGQLSKEMVFYSSPVDYDITLWDEMGNLLRKSTTLPKEPLAELHQKSEELKQSIQKMEEQLKQLKPDSNDAK